jgi:hypothetical protein
VNFGTPVPLLIGIVLILIAVILFFLDRLKPGYKRDSDVIYAILFLTAGIIALSELTIGILQSLQLMIFTGTLIALLIDNVRRRNPNNAPVGRVAGGEAPFRGEPEPSPRSYRDYDRPRYDTPPPRSDIYAELEEQDEMMPPVGNGANVRRIRGSREEQRRSSRDTSGYADSYNSYSSDTYTQDTYTEESPRERRERRRAGSQSANSGNSGSGNTGSGNSGLDDEVTYSSERPRRRKQLQLEPETSDGVGIISYSDVTSAGAATTEGHTSRRRSRPSEASSESRTEAADEFSTSTTRSSRRRPRPSRPADDLDPSPSNGEYVDFKPIKPLRRGSDQDNNNFDDTRTGPEF